MDKLDKEILNELSEPAKRVFFSLDFRSQRRMLKQAKEMAKIEKRKERQKDRIKKKSVRKRQDKKKGKRGSSIKKQDRPAFFVGEELKDC